MVLDKFSGGNPTEWISRAEQYFTYLGFSENDWLPLASFYLDDDALDWFQWLHRNKQFFHWKHFTEKLTLRFRIDSNMTHNHINIALDLLRKLEEKLGNVERALCARSHSVVAKPVLPDVDDTRDSDLPCDESAFIVEDPTDSDSDTVDECVHSWCADQTHMQVLLPDLTSDLHDGTSKEVSRIYVCKVFAEMPEKEIDIKIVDSVKNALVKPEPQVFDELFHTISIVRCSSTPVKVEELLCALSCMLPACSQVRGLFSYLSELGHAKLSLFVYRFSPDQCRSHFPFDPGSNWFTTFFGSIRDCVCWGALSSCNNSRFMTLNRKNSRITPFKLRLRNTNRVCKCVFWEDTDDDRRYPSYFIVCSLDMLPELVECHGYDLKCLVSQSNLVGKGVILHVWDPGIHRQPMKLNHWNNDILSIIQTQGGLMNVKQFKRPVCGLIVHQSETFLVCGEIEKWEVRRSIFQKLDHRQLVEILRDEREPVPAKWTAERHAKYIWGEVLDGTRWMHKHIFIHFPFDPGEFVPPSIRFESLNLHWDILPYLSIAMYSSVFLLDCTMKDGKLFNEMSSSKVSIQTGQPRLPKPLPKPSFSALPLDFLSQVEQSIEIAKEFDCDGLVMTGGVDSKINYRLFGANSSRKIQPTAVALAAILQEWKVLRLSYGGKVKLQVVNPTGCTFYCVIKTVDWVGHHRLHHGLVAMERFGGEAVSKIVHQYLKVENFSFDESERVKTYHLHHISSASGASFDPSSTPDDILGISLFDTNTTILAYYGCVSFDRKGIDVEKEWGTKGIAEYVSYIIGCFTLLCISGIIAHLCHVILCKVINVQKVIKNVEVNSRVLQAANHIMIQFVKVFTCRGQGTYNTSSCRMKFTDMNLEDKVLFEGGSIVVNQDDSVSAYGLEVVNKTDLVEIIGPTKVLQSFMWDPGPISNWL